jgi:hypothetical protein
MQEEAVTFLKKREQSDQALAEFLLASAQVDLTPRSLKHAHRARVRV